MLIKTLPVGQLETNCYIVTDEKTLQCAVIDPGADSNTILDYLEGAGLAVEAIFLTHGHFDHTTAAATVREATGAPIYIHKNDIAAPGGDNSHKYHADPDVKTYGEGDVFTIGGLTFTVMETPGHSFGSVTLRCEDALFTGDTLFRDSCGRTDLGGDMQTLMRSLKRLYDLPGDYEVYPGHMDASTLTRERTFNYYMRYANGDA